jgi:hypothetical protein
MSNTNLAKYYPIIYKDVLETDHLVSTENELFDELDSLTLEAEQNQFILTSNARGLTIYENMLNIIANPQLDSIQFRRERIINRLSTVPPFTIRELRNKLDQLLGDDNYIIDLVHREYKLNLTTYIGVYGKLDEMLRTLFVMIPVNLEKHILNLLIQEKETSLYRGQVLDLSMEYTLSADFNGNYDVQANERIGQVVDVSKDYLLSSDIVSSTTVQADAKAGSVVNAGTVYEIQ